MTEKEREIQKLIETLSPIERAVLPFLQEKSIKDIETRAGLDETSVLRALQFLKNKRVVVLKETEKQIIDLDINGLLYVKKGLPERRLLHLVAEKKSISLKDAQKASNLNDNEFKAALGALKKKALINLVNQNILLEAKKEEITKKSLEEQFLESLPLDLSELKDEQKFALQNLKNRKKIILIEKKKDISIETTELGNKILSQDLTKLKEEFIEQLTPELITSGKYKGKKFRRYDIQSQVPKLYGGKRHFVNQATDYARKIWTELGFQEMTGNLSQSSFWVFDALFTAQDHPVRDLQDTFYIENTQFDLPDKTLVKQVKQSHESGIDSSKGWQYKWQEQEAMKPVLRTHTTCLSAQTLANLSKLKTELKKGKFFAIGKCFRNETIDSSHLFEFNQTEGIVIDKEANFRHLLGYLREFLRKMGFEKIRFRPHFFPYTEPSVEADVYNEQTKKWVEILGAGIFRPEVVVPLLGEYIPVLAWGMGFDRLVMENYKITDIRELYKNDINKLREIKFWDK